MTTEEAKYKIFSTIISCEISLYTALYTPDKAVVPISNIISLIDGLTKYRARLALKELINEDLLYYTSQGCPALLSPSTELHYAELIDDAHPPINGYALTKKAFESQQWKEAYSSWNKSMEDWANSI